MAPAYAPVRGTLAVAVVPQPMCGLSDAEWLRRSPTVWVDVEMTRTDRQKQPSFVDAQADALVLVRLVHMASRTGSGSIETG